MKDKKKQIVKDLINPEKKDNQTVVGFKHINRTYDPNDNLLSEKEEYPGMVQVSFEGNEFITDEEFDKIPGKTEKIVIYWEGIKWD